MNRDEVNVLLAISAAMLAGIFLGFVLIVVYNLIWG
jgi:hypothetical protein